MAGQQLGSGSGWRGRGNGLVAQSKRQTSPNKAMRKVISTARGTSNAFAPGGAGGNAAGRTADEREHASSLRYL